MLTLLTFVATRRSSSKLDYALAAPNVKMVDGKVVFDSLWDMLKFIGGENGAEIKNTP